MELPLSDDRYLEVPAGFFHGRRYVDRSRGRPSLSLGDLPVLQFRPDLGIDTHMIAKGFDRRACRHGIVAAFRRQPGGPLRGHHQPNGRMGFLVRLRHYLDLGHLTIFNIRLFRDVPGMVGNVLGWKGIVLSFMREEILGPCLNDSINCLGEQVPVPALVPRVSRNVEGHVFTRPASAPETHFHPSLRHLVQQGNVFGEPNGMP